MPAIMTLKAEIAGRKVCLHNDNFNVTIPLPENFKFLRNMRTADVRVRVYYKTGTQPLRVELLDMR
jgi:hypothetical protein